MTRQWLTLDAEYAYSRGRFRARERRDEDPAGDRIPGAIEGVASVGLNFIELRGVSGELRYRYFGPRPLLEDDSVRSEASNLVNARIGYRLSPRVRVDVDVFNVLDAQVSDIDYFYESRLRGEVAPVEDVHFHPVEKRSARIAIVTSF